MAWLTSWLRWTSEKKVRAALRSSEEYRINLGPLQGAWNPKAVVPLGFGPGHFYGPGAVIYRKGPNGEVNATFDPTIRA
jgi:hypothetical protein